MNAMPPDAETAIVPRPAAIWRWIDVFWVAVASIFLIVFLSTTIGWAANLHSPLEVNASSQPLWFNAVLAGVEALGLIVAVYFVGMRPRGLTWTHLGLGRPQLSWLVVAFLGAMALIPLVGVIVLAIQALLGIPMNNPQLEFLAPQAFSWPAAAGMFIFAGLAAPFAEELFFRGMLYTWLSNRFNPLLAALVSSLLFGLLHGEVSIAGATFVMGLALAWFYQHSRSLWTSILIHAVNNCFKLFVLYLFIALGIDIPTM